MKHLFLAVVCLLGSGCRCGPKSQEGAPPGRAIEEELDRLQRLEYRLADPDGQIIGALSHRQPRVRARACLAAARIGSRAALDAIVQLVGDDQPTVRQSAVVALNLLAPWDNPAQRQRVQDTLLWRLVRETDLSVRGHVLLALGRIGDARAAAEVERQVTAGKTTEAALTALVLLGRRGMLSGGILELLLERLASPSSQQRLLSALALSQLSTSQLSASQLSASQLLASQLVASQRSRAGSGEPWIRRAMAGLRGAMGDANEQAAQAAARALGRLIAVTREMEPRMLMQGLLQGLLQGLMDHRPRVQVAAVRALSATFPQGVDRLARGLAKLWRSTSANHFRLTGAQLHPILVGLDALETHSRAEPVRRLAQEMLELADASDAAVTYQPKEAHSVDLVHCAAARLWDLGRGRLDRIRSCGTAGSDRLTPAMRRAMVSRLIADLASQGNAGKEARPEGASVDAAKWQARPIAGFPELDKLVTTARIVTHRGVIDLRLLVEHAPVAVARFVSAVSKGQLRSMGIERVSPFDVLHTGYLGGDLEQLVPYERSPLPFVHGSVGLVAGARGSRLFITLGRQPERDGRNLQLARVTEGLELLERLQPGDPILDIHLGVPSPSGK